MSPQSREPQEPPEASPAASSEPVTEPVTESAPEPAPERAPEPASKPAPDSPPPRPWPRRHPVWAGLLGLVSLVLVYVLWQALTWPDVARLATENPYTTAFIERWKRQQQGREGDAEPAWRWVPYARISPHLKRAVLVSEDINFFTHQGFETTEIGKALEEAWKERELPRGASTLTQQLAKNLWLSPSKNPLRKLKEALLTRQLERHLTKQRILELYLNVVELGPGIYGAEAAARHWFGVPALDLTELQAAQLAASLPRPRTWHPGVSSQYYARRVESVLRRMEKARWLWNEI